jgi:ABC-type amino acid transport substrate-binding protein
MGALALLILAMFASPAPGEAIRVGMDPRAAPWVFVPGYDYTRQPFFSPPRLTARQLTRLTGLEIDILRALERRMGSRFEVVQTRWVDLEKDLLESRFDVILNAWTPSPATSGKIAATDPYYAWGLLVAVRQDEAGVRSVADLVGRRLGHVSDPTVLSAVRAMSDSVGARRVVVDQGGEEMFRRLDRGELDAVVFDSAYVRWRVARDIHYRVVGEPLNRLGYHAGVRSEAGLLLARLQSAIRDFVDSGESREIRRVWESRETPSPFEPADAR